MSKRPLSNKAVFLPDDLPPDVLERLDSIVTHFGGHLTTSPLESQYIITNPPYESSDVYRLYTAHVATLEPDEPRPMLRPYHWLFASYIAGNLLKSKDVPPVPVLQHVERGCHRPLRVYVSLNVVKADSEATAQEAQTNVINLIEANGGVRSDKRGTADVLLLNLETEAGRRYESERKEGQVVVERSWLERKLGLKPTEAVEEEEPREGEDELDSFGEDEPVGYKRKPNRQEFTQKDDEYLSRWLAYIDPNQKRWMSVGFYDKELLSNPAYSSWADRHTAQSWKERVKKHAARFRLRVDALKDAGLDATLKTRQQRQSMARMADETPVEDDRGRAAKRPRTDDAADDEDAAQYAIRHARRQQAQKQVTQVKIASQHAKRLETQRAYGDEQAEQFGAGSDDEMDRGEQTENAARQTKTNGKVVAVQRDTFDVVHRERPGRNGNEEVGEPHVDPSHTVVPAQSRTPSIPALWTSMASRKAAASAGSKQPTPLGRRTPAMPDSRRSPALASNRADVVPPRVTPGHTRTPSIPNPEEPPKDQPQAGPSTSVVRTPSIALREASTDPHQVRHAVELDSEDERTEEDMRRSMQARSQRLAEAVSAEHANDGTGEQHRRPPSAQPAVAVRSPTDQMSAEAVVRQFYGAIGFVPHGPPHSVAASGKRQPRASEPSRGLVPVDEERSTMMQRAKERRSVGGFAPAAVSIGGDGRDSEDELEDTRSVPVTVTGRLQIDSIQLSPRGKGRAVTPNLTTRSSSLGQRQPLFAAQSSPPRSSPPPPAGQSRPPVPNHHAANLGPVVEAGIDRSEAGIPPLEPTANLHVDRQRHAQRGQQTLKKVAQMAHQWGMDPKEMLAIVTQHQKENGGRTKQSELVELLKSAKAAKLKSGQAGVRR